MIESLTLYMAVRHCIWKQSVSECGWEDGMGSGKRLLSGTITSHLCADHAGSGLKSDMFRRHASDRVGWGGRGFIRTLISPLHCQRAFPSPGESAQGATSSCRSHSRYQQGESWRAAGLTISGMSAFCDCSQKEEFLLPPGQELCDSHVVIDFTKPTYWSGHNEGPRYRGFSLSSNMPL